MNKTKPLVITLICFIAILIIGLTILLIVILTNTGKNKFGGINLSTKVSNKVGYEKSYDNIFKNINIKVDAGDVEIIKSQNEEIRVVIYSDYENFNVDNYSENLHINIKTKNCKWFCLNIVKTKVILYLPTNYSENIDVNVNYGNINIGSFASSNIEIKQDCGDVNIEKGNIIDIESNFGNVYVGGANELKIDTSCGDIDVGDVSSITANNSLGNIEIDNILEYLDLKNDCGDIKINTINLIKNSKINSNLGDIKIKEINDIYIKAKTHLGEKNIGKNNNNSNIILSVNNDCGDIKINK